jgi:hypothetical protein
MRDAGLLPLELEDLIMSEPTSGRRSLPAEHAAAIVDLALTVVAIGAAIVAMGKCECRGCNGHDRG